MLWLWLLLAFLGGAACGAAAMVVWLLDEDTRRAFDRLDAIADELARHRRI